MNGAQGPSYSASKALSKVLATLYAYDAAVLTDLDHGEMTGILHVKAFQVRPILFNLCA
jgi:hypothetical protein